MAQLLAPQALLFDLDGVIADVSRSYRRAIIGTAETFGVTLDVATVRDAKAAGNANNDWILTRRLLQQHGKDVTLQQVTERFERMYQGSATEPGLWQTETLLVSPQLLARLANRLPLGIVTGRPRHDARRFMDNTAIGRYFRAMVCMEDAPIKPNPAPVCLLMQQLTVQRAWMIGDTPDDIRAATAAGAIGLGIVAPEDDAETTAQTLIDAGAERVLRELGELERLLDHLS